MATVSLQGGLQLSKSRFDLSPGRLIECLNRETIGGKPGYHRIQGFRSYSGGCQFNNFPAYVFLEPGVALSPKEFYWAPRGSATDSSGLFVTHSGHCRVFLWYSGAPAYYAAIGISGRLPRSGDEIRDEDGDLIGYIDGDPMMENVLSFSEISSFPAASDVFDCLNLVETTNLGREGAENNGAVLPFQSALGGPPGMFYWRDRLYVVADINTWSFTSGSEEPSVGDSLQITDSDMNTYDVTVERVITNGGAWASGTAEGEVWFRESFTIEQLGDATISSVDNTDTTTTDVLTLGNEVEPSYAVLLRDTGLYSYNLIPAWERIDLGHEVRFTAGQTNPIPVLNRLTQDTDIESAITATTAAYSSTQVGTSWTDIANIGADNASFARKTIASGVMGGFMASEFGISVPALSIITGVTVEIERYEDGATWAVFDYEVELRSGSLRSGNRAKAAAWPGAAGTTVSYGGENDTWGLSLEPQDVESDEFKVWVRAQGVGSGGGDARVDFVRVIVHYKPYSSTVHFRNATTATDVATGEAVWWYKDSGDWSTSDAKGILTFYNISDPSAIVEGLQIRSAASGGGNLYATTDGGADQVYLPSSSRCNAANSQYEFIRGNFYGADKYEQVFGVNGVGPGFSFDGTYFIHMRSGLADELERPRHVAKHASQLALGYAHGDTAFSDVGEPESFAAVVDGNSPRSNAILNPDFTGGSVVISTGDAVTGLIPLAEQALGVGCQESIYSIIGSAGNFALNLIRGDSGVLEYTMKDLGVVLFCDFRGIGTIRASDKFGNYEPGYLSDDVAEWLVPRIQDSSASSSSARGVIRAELVRNKRQYRLYFRDGYILTMTLQGNELFPEFTMQRYEDSAGNAVVAVATCAGVMSIGRDVQFMTTQPITAGSYYAYQIDAGNTFDGTQIKERILIHAGDFGDPVTKKQFKNVSIHGRAYAYADLGISYKVNYDELTYGFASSPVAVTFGATTNTTFQKFVVPQTYTATVAANQSGYALTVQIESGNANYDGVSDTYKKFTRPHSIEAMSIEIEGERKRVAGR